jgi:hypothetical protein
LAGIKKARMNKAKQIFFSLLVPVCICLAVQAQNSVSDQQEGIKLNAFVREAKVPRNCFVELVIQLSWSGQLDHYEVKPFDNPILQNLEIQGSGSANRVSAEGGRATAVREYTFQLKPQSIGMGYVEPLIILYTDSESNRQYSLTTNRISVHIIDPVPEPSDKKVLWRALGILIVGSAAGWSWRKLYLKKKERRERLAQEMSVVKPLEENYLDELKTIFDPSDYSLDGNQAFSQMSRLLRRFLHDKFSAPGLEATSSELYQFFYDQKFEDRFINEIRDLMSNADVIKFSGKSVDRNDAALMMSRVESIFHSSLRNEIHHSS